MNRHSLTKWKEIRANPAAVEAAKQTLRRYAGEDNFACIGWHYKTGDLLIGSDNHHHMVALNIVELKMVVETNPSFFPTDKQVQKVCAYVESRGGLVSAKWVATHNGGYMFEKERYGAWEITAKRRIQDRFETFHVAWVTVEEGQIFTTYDIDRGETVRLRFEAVKRGDRILTSTEEYLLKEGKGCTK